jgi:hypothetical protein
MCEIPDRARSGSTGGVEDEDSDFDPVTDWEDSTSGEETRDLVWAANAKVKLFTILRSYNIIPLKEVNNPWSAKITCPFLAHKGGRERTPSFNYNFEKDYFYCMGCKRSGRAVEFIAYKEGLDRYEVAISLLEHYGDVPTAEEFEAGQDFSVLEKELFGLAMTFCEHVQAVKHDPKKLAGIENLIWTFDCYVWANASKHKIDVEELRKRTSYYKELLNDDEEETTHHSG